MFYSCRVFNPLNAINWPKFKVQSEKCFVFRPVSSTCSFMRAHRAKISFRKSYLAPFSAIRINLWHPIEQIQNSSSSGLSFDVIRCKRGYLTCRHGTELNANNNSANQRKATFSNNKANSTGAAFFGLFFRKYWKFDFVNLKFVRNGSTELQSFVYHFVGNFKLFYKTIKIFFFVIFTVSGVTSVRCDHGVVWSMFHIDT